MLPFVQKIALNTSVPLFLPSIDRIDLPVKRTVFYLHKRLSFMSCICLFKHYRFQWKIKYHELLHKTLDSKRPITWRLKRKHLVHIGHYVFGSGPIHLQERQPRRRSLYQLIILHVSNIRSLPHVLCFILLFSFFINCFKCLSYRHQVFNVSHSQSLT